MIEPIVGWCKYCASINMRLPKEIKNECAAMYKNGASFEEIMFKMNVSRGTVYNSIRERGVQIRKIGSHKRVNFFNENYFSQIDTPEKAYWLGFIAADGCLQEKNYTLCIRLASKDISILEQFCRDINFSINKISNSTRVLGGKTLYASSVRLNSQILYNDMLKLGIGPRKSLTFERVEIERHFFKDFLRGYFDGDGCILKQFNRIDIAVSNPSSIWFSENISKSGIKNKIITHGKISYIQIFGLKNILKFESYIYEGDFFCLERKREIFRLKKRETVPEKKEREADIIRALREDGIISYKKTQSITGLSLDRIHHLVKYINANNTISKQS